MTFSMDWLASWSHGSRAAIDSQKPCSFRIASAGSLRTRPSLASAAQIAPPEVPLNATT